MKRRLLGLALALTLGGAASAQTLRLDQFPVAQSPLPANTPLYCAQWLGTFWQTTQCPLSQVSAYLLNANNAWNGLNNFIGGDLTINGSPAIGSATGASVVGDVATYSNNTGSGIQDGGVLLSALATSASVAAGYVPNATASVINLNGGTPPAALSGAVLDEVQANTVGARHQQTSYAATSVFSGVRYDGTNAAPTAVQGNEEIASFNAWPYNGTSLNSTASASLRFYAATNLSVGNFGTYACLATTPISSTTLANGLCQGNDAGVYIGSATDEGAGTLDAITLYQNGVPLTSLATQSPSSVAITGGSIQYATLKVAGTTNLLESSTAPTIASGFSSSGAAIAAANGTATFEITIGTTPSSSGVLTMPAAANGWNCFASDRTTHSTSVSQTIETANSATSVTLTQYNDVMTATPWVASDLVQVMCAAY